MGTEKKGTSKLAVLFYVLAALMGILFIVMLVINIKYINNYIASYGMTFKSMWKDAIQYIITGSVNYLAYAIILFGIGKIIEKLDLRSKDEEIVERTYVKEIIRDAEPVDEDDNENETEEAAEADVEEKDAQIEEAKADTEENYDQVEQTEEVSEGDSSDDDNEENPKVNEEADKEQNGAEDTEEAVETVNEKTQEEK